MAEPSFATYANFPVGSTVTETGLVPVPTGAPTEVRIPVLALIAGIWVPVIVRPAALVVAALMVGAIAMHVKVKDPVQRSLPALAVLVMCLWIATQR